MIVRFEQNYDNDLSLRLERTQAYRKDIFVEGGRDHPRSGSLLKRKPKSTQDTPQKNGRQSLPTLNPFNAELANEFN